MMPYGCDGLEGTEQLFIQLWLQRIWTPFTWTSEESILPGLLLDDKVMGMKFKEGIIITSNAIYRKQTLICIRHM
jgi:hypothetical protein